LAHRNERQTVLQESAFQVCAQDGSAAPQDNYGKPVDLDAVRIGKFG
jgi:hypothetical protein